MNKAGAETEYKTYERVENEHTGVKLVQLFPDIQGQYVLPGKWNGKDMFCLKMEVLKGLEYWLRNKDPKNIFKKKDDQTEVLKLPTGQSTVYMIIRVEYE